MRPDFERAKAYIFSRLGAELSPSLTYHSLLHTRDEVLPAAFRLGQRAQLGDEDMLLLGTAALYHDSGFLYHYHDHEAESIAIAQATLPDFGYRPSQIHQINLMIAATRMPQHPGTILEELLCDADLDLLGREDFWPRNRDLLIETRLYLNSGVTERNWLEGQTRFLEEHVYFSGVAQALRDAGKRQNLALMKHALASLNGNGESSYPVE